MNSAVEQFRISIARVRDLISIYNSMSSQVTAVLDLSDILRAALVLTVSALDYYVHEVVTLGMLEIYRGQRSEPISSRNQSSSAFARFQVSLGNARTERLIALDIASWLEDEIRENQGSDFLEQSYSVSDFIPILSSSLSRRLNQDCWLEDEIRVRLGYQSFQQPEKIADAIRLISDKKLWDEVATHLGKQTQEVKQQLSLIVDRRNKIAHEADIDPTFGIGGRWEINPEMANDTVDFIEQVVESIHQVLEND
ncbi:hypothetical protein K4A83_00035 [Spirulina subsalsa FACHB-351]|uniref:RiboL-PSP-HEPN domain-containing protein n=1 Tax=Spirulina subsalsa FACHB-351 TaxID=234711 RepID=A0ABT3KZM5_9CYAN|nr:HEPN domain-containing protein [Spirulina subsalsa]MCW6034666.1 hypothetical protein [Spirulina subsalsa FACHB-351]